MASSNDSEFMSPNLWWWIALGISGFFVIALLLSLLAAWCCYYRPCNPTFYSARLAAEERQKRRRRRQRQREQLRKANGGLGKVARSAAIEDNPQSRGDSSEQPDHNGEDGGVHEVRFGGDDDDDRLPAHLAGREDASAKSASDTREESPTTSDDSTRPGGTGGDGTHRNPFTLSAMEVSPRQGTHGRPRKAASASRGQQHDALSNTLQELDELPSSRTGRRAASSTVPTAVGVVRKTLPLPSQPTLRERSPMRPTSSSAPSAGRARQADQADRYPTSVLAEDRVPKPATRATSTPRPAAPLSPSHISGSSVGGPSREQQQQQQQQRPPSPQAPALVRDSQISPRRKEEGSGVGKNSGNALTPSALRRQASLGSASGLLPDGTRPSRPKSRTNSHVTFLDEAPANDGMLADGPDTNASRALYDNDAPDRERGTAADFFSSAAPPVVREAMPMIQPTRERRNSVTASPASSLTRPGRGAAGPARSSDTAQRTSVQQQQQPETSGYYTFASPSSAGERRGSSPARGGGENSDDAAARRSRQKNTSRSNNNSNSNRTLPQRHATPPALPSSNSAAAAGKLLPLSGVDETTTVSSNHNSLASTQTPPAATGTTHTHSPADSDYAPTPRPEEDATAAVLTPTRLPPPHGQSPSRDVTTPRHAQHHGGGSTRSTAPPNPMPPPPPVVGMTTLTNQRRDPLRTQAHPQRAHGDAGGDLYYPSDERPGDSAANTAATAAVYPHASGNAASTTPNRAPGNLGADGGNAPVYDTPYGGNDTENASFVSEVDTIPAAPIACFSYKGGQVSPRLVTPSPPSANGPRTPTPRQHSAERNGTMPPPPVVVPLTIVDGSVAPRVDSPEAITGGNTHRAGHSASSLPPSSSLRQSSARLRGRSPLQTQVPDPQPQRQRRASEPPTTTTTAASGEASIANGGSTLTAAALASHRSRSSSGIRVLKITPAPGAVASTNNNSSANSRGYDGPQHQAQPEAAFNALGSAPYPGNSAAANPAEGNAGGLRDRESATSPQPQPQPQVQVQSQQQQHRPPLGHHTAHFGGLAARPGDYYHHPAAGSGGRSSSSSLRDAQLQQQQRPRRNSGSAPAVASSNSSNSMLQQYQSASARARRQGSASMGSGATLNAPYSQTQQPLAVGGSYYSRAGGSSSARHNDGQWHPNSGGGGP